MPMLDPDSIGLAIGTAQLVDNQQADFHIDVMGVNASIGSPVPVVEVIASLMRDGDLTRTTKFGNREAVFDIILSADDHDGLTAGEIYLETQLDRANDLVWSIGYGPDTTFKVVTSWSEFMMDQVTEHNIKWIFRVHFICLPFGQSSTATVINWNGPGIALRSVGSTSGWTSRSGGGTLSTATSPTRLTRTTSGPLLLRTTPTNPLKKFIYIRSSAVATTTSNPPQLNMVIGGVAIPNAQVFGTEIGTQQRRRAIMVEVPDQFVGTTPQIDFDIIPISGAGVLYCFDSTNYPNLPDLTALASSETGGQLSANFGIDVIEIPGTARANFVLEFTSTGPAWVYTAPNPRTDLRERGLPQLQWVYQVTVDPPDNYLISHVSYPAQPKPLFPDGIWPLSGFSGSAGVESRYSYPASDDARVTFFKTAGTHRLVSADHFLPMGYHDGAIAHKNHVLHPFGSGFSVLDHLGNPIAATLTMFAHWKHHAGS